ncbi:MAG: enoyl-CoA hydratase/isomerase [Deltaproteobacteria bacterium]|nr:enoyl-CoA hydratase/isomerase [Deltaproteobacteria bacterium]
MAFQRVQLSFTDNVAVLTLNHPEVLNAVSVQMLRELTAALDEIEDPEKEARCLILTGAGRGFCAGAHLDDPESSRSQGELKAGSLLEKWYHPILLRLRDLRMPIITAVNGPAAGVGMSLALMGDLVIAARSSYFLQAFRRIGLIPDGGSTFLLPRKVGWARAVELSMLAERLSAEKALEWGLVNRVVDEGQTLKAALDLGRELAAGPTISMALIRKAYWQSFSNTYEQQLHLESELQTEAGRTQDFAEGRTAFLEKRPPVFKGK